jgi:hypothetical protein
MGPEGAWEVGMRRAAVVSWEWHCGVRHFLRGWVDTDVCVELRMGREIGWALKVKEEGVHKECGRGPELAGRGGSRRAVSVRQQVSPGREHVWEGRGRCVCGDVKSNWAVSRDGCGLLWVCVGSMVDVVFNCGQL